jgi:hypothetical protein
MDYTDDPYYSDQLEQFYKGQLKSLSVSYKGLVGQVAEREFS